MGRRISFSVARLDKEAFITGPCLWPKVLQDMIYNLKMFFSWSSPPTPPKKVGECSRTGVPVAAVCNVHTQLRMAHWDSTLALCGTNGTNTMYVRWPERRQWVICDRHLRPLAQDSAQVLLSIPAAAPGHLPPLKFVDDKAWDRDLLPLLQIFNQIAAVMVCIYCNVFLQINIALK